MRPAMMGNLVATLDNFDAGLGVSFDSEAGNEPGCWNFLSLQ